MIEGGYDTTILDYNFKVGNGSVVLDTAVKKKFKTKFILSGYGFRRKDVDAKYANSNLSYTFGKKGMEIVNSL